MYDGHGNMIGAVARNGAGFSLANEKTYDVWGAVRSDSGAVSGQILNPNTKYCANLGHKYDSGTELTYMRARYYEAATGRFISEDPARDGANWFSYCGNSPTVYKDSTGTSKELASGLAILAAVMFASATLILMSESKNPKAQVVSAMTLIALGFMALALAEKEANVPWAMAFASNTISMFVSAIMAQKAAGDATDKLSKANAAVKPIAGFYLYHSMFIMFYIGMAFEEG